MKIAKPNINSKLKSGFRPAAGLSTRGKLGQIPHTSGSTGTNSGYQYKLNLAGVGKRGRKMY